MAALYRKRIDARAADIRFAIDALARDKRLAKLFQGRARIATDRVAVFGHSIGGVAAVEAARRDARIVAAANLDGHFASYPCLSDAEPRAEHLETLVIEDKPPIPGDPQLKVVGQSADAIEKARAEWLAARDDEIRARLGQWLRLLVPVERHSDFSDEPFFYPQWTSEAAARRRQCLDDVRRALRELFAGRLAPGRND